MGGGGTDNRKPANGKTNFPHNFGYSINISCDFMASGNEINVVFEFMLLIVTSYKTKSDEKKGKLKYLNGDVTYSNIMMSLLTSIRPKSNQQ